MRLKTIAVQLLLSFEVSKNRFVSGVFEPEVEWLFPFFTDFQRQQQQQPEVSNPCVLFIFNLV